MLRTIAAVLAAPALLWTVGCGSSSSSAPVGGASQPSAAASGHAASAASASDAGSATSSLPAAVSANTGSSASGAAAKTGTVAKPGTTEEHLARGLKFSEQGRRRDAINAYAAALKLDPQNLAALLYRAGEQYALQEFDAAERDLTQALAVDATFAEAYILRAHLAGVKHDYQRAVDDFYTALKHPERDANFPKYFGDKKDVVAHVYLAAAYSECPDIAFRDDAKAFQHALKACDLDRWQNRRYVSVLVNAIAGSKTQEEAIRRHQEAVSAAPSETVKIQLQGAVEAFDLRSEFPLR